MLVDPKTGKADARSKMKTDRRSDARRVKSGAVIETAKEASSDMSMADEKKQPQGKTKAGATTAHPEQEAEAAKKKAARAAEGKGGKGGGSRARQPRRSLTRASKPGPAASAAPYYEKEVVPALMKEFGSRTRWRFRAREDRRSTWASARPCEPEDHRLRRRGAARDHRPEAGRDRAQEVDRDLQAPRGPADRRDGHAAPRADVGVPRPPHQLRAPARA